MSSKIQTTLPKDWATAKATKRGENQRRKEIDAFSRQQKRDTKRTRKTGLFL